VVLGVYLGGRRIIKTKKKKKKIGKWKQEKGRNTM
jgi:hypothetical protein